MPNLKITIRLCGVVWYDVHTLLKKIEKFTTELEGGAAAAPPPPSD